jgi:hypothetical protein
MPPDAERRPRREGGAQDGADSNVKASVPLRPVKSPRCAHLFPGLTGCPNRAEPGSRYCAEHGGES